MGFEVPTGWRKLLVAFGALAVTGLTAMVAVAALTGRYPLYDLRVYLWGAQQVLDGQDLYTGQEPLTGALFTYPPFSAVFFVPLELLGGKAAAIAWSAASIAALCRTSWLLAKATSMGPVVVVGAGFVATAALLEPTITTLLWGQINMILLWLVTEDRLGAVPKAARGVLTGLAAGLKITPALFIVNLLTTRHWRDGLRAIATAVGTLLIGAIAAPESTWSYFNGTLQDTNRIAEDNSLNHPGNQSMDGLVSRIFGPGEPTWVWLVMVVAVTGCALIVARRFDGAGRPLEELAVMGLAMLLVTPISWSHHWVWTLPALAVLAQQAFVRRDRLAVVLLVAALVVLAAEFNIWAPGIGADFPWILRQIVWNPYVILGLVLLAYLWRQAARPAIARAVEAKPI